MRAHHTTFNAKAELDAGVPAGAACGGVERPFLGWVTSSCKHLHAMFLTMPHIGTREEAALQRSSRVLTALVG